MRYNFCKKKKKKYALWETLLYLFVEVPNNLVLNKGMSSYNSLINTTIKRDFFLKEIILLTRDSNCLSMNKAYKGRG